MARWRRKEAYESETILMVATKLVRYNFVRIHQTLRWTSGMVAGFDTTRSELSDIINVLEHCESAL